MAKSEDTQRTKNLDLTYKSIRSTISSVIQIQHTRSSITIAYIQKSMNIHLSACLCHSLMSKYANISEMRDQTCYGMVILTARITLNFTV